LLGVELATVVVLTGVFEAGTIGLAFARIAGLGLAIGAAVGFTATMINYYAHGTRLLFAMSLLAPYVAYFAAESVGASGVLAVVIAGFVASWRIQYIAPESRVELYSSWDHLSFILNAVMFLYVGLETPQRLEHVIETDPGIVRIALTVGVAVIGARLVWMFPAAYLPLWLSQRLRRREGGYPDPRSLILVSWCGVRGAVSLAAALSVPVLLRDGTPFPGRPEIIACTLVVIVVTLIGQGLTLGPLVRGLGVSDADPTDLEVRRAREAMLAAGIARLDAYCTEESCPIAIYRLRDAMSDQLISLQAEDESARSEALRRLEVASEVRRAVYAAKTDALLTLRDGGALNDRVHQQLQLDLDRANADLQEG
jgi:CPA1 family monovalent cation:H+ antiporter